MKLAEIGMTMIYLGLTKKGNLPAVCSHRIAVNLSKDPMTAL